MTDPTLTFTAANGAPFTVRLVDLDSPRPSIKIMDDRQDPLWGVSAYFVETFTAITGALTLDTGSSFWQWSDTDVQQVQRWLRSQLAREVKHSFVGRTEEGHRLFVSMGLDFDNGRAAVTSTEHETIPRPVTLAITGSTVSPESARRGDTEAGGQNIDDLRTAVDDPASSWTQADRDSLLEIWERWHLNTLRGGCVHQPDESIVYESPRGYPQIDLENTPRCPVTGYKWGSAWLAEQVPDDVLVELHRLMDLPVGNAPAWLRR